MAAIPSLHIFNKEREEFLKIQTANKETVLFTANEAKEVLQKYFKDELRLFTDHHLRERQTQITTRLDEKLLSFEKRMMEIIDNKFDNLTENIVARITNSKINEEVELRIEQKIKELKKLL